MTWLLLFVGTFMQLTCIAGLSPLPASHIWAFLRKSRTSSTLIDIPGIWGQISVVWICHSQLTLRVFESNLACSSCQFSICSILL